MQLVIENERCPAAGVALEPALILRRVEIEERCPCVALKRLRDRLPAALRRGRRRVCTGSHSGGRAIPTACSVLHFAPSLECKGCWRLAPGEAQNDWPRRCSEHRQHGGEGRIGGLAGIDGEKRIATTDLHACRGGGRVERTATFHSDNARWPALGLATRIRFYTQIEAQRTFELQPHFILRARNVGTGPAIAELRAVVRMAGETGRC